MQSEYLTFNLYVNIVNDNYFIKTKSICKRTINWKNIQHKLVCGFHGVHRITFVNFYISTDWRVFIKLRQKKSHIDKKIFFNEPYRWRVQTIKRQCIYSIHIPLVVPFLYLCRSHALSFFYSSFYQLAILPLSGFIWCTYLVGVRLSLVTWTAHQFPNIFTRIGLR